jgi:hypothetical protein
MMRVICAQRVIRESSEVGHALHILHVVVGAPVPLCARLGANAKNLA